MTLPVIDLRGDYARQGEAHGRVAARAIARNIDVYFARFMGEAGMTRAEVAERAAAVWAHLEAAAPDYAAGVRGIARGAGVPLSDIVALNARYEIVYSRMTELYMAGECTAFAIEGPCSADGHWLLGQNWDWIPDVAGVVLRTPATAETPATVSFSEAGIFGGKIGLNGAGVGLAVNGLQSTTDDWRRAAVPFHVRTWRALRASTLADAAAVLTAGPRACAANFVVGQAGVGVVDLETAPGACVELGARDGLVVHANHFTDPEGLGVVEPPNPRRVHSCHRAERLLTLLEADPAPSRASLQRHLRDHEGHPNSVCRHPDLNPTRPSFYQSVTSVIMDLNERRMWLTDGPPCASDYTEVGLWAPAAAGEGTLSPPAAS